MSNIDKQALREAAATAKIAGEAPVMPFDQRITALNDFMKQCTPATVLALLDELEAKDKQIDDLEATVAHYNAGWKEAHEQEARAEVAEKRIAEQREVMRQAASDISYAIYNLTGSDLSRLKPGVVETTDPTDTALIAERSLRAAASKGEAS